MLVVLVFCSGVAVAVPVVYTRVIGFLPVLVFVLLLL